MVGIWLASGEPVPCIPMRVGVHDGTMVIRGVTVKVGSTAVGKRVGGGKGLIILFGFVNIIEKTTTTHKIVTSITIVKIFHTRADDLFLGLDLLAWGKSKLSIHHLPLNMHYGNKICIAL